MHEAFRNSDYSETFKLRVVYELKLTWDVQEPEHVLFKTQELLMVSSRT